MIKKYKKEIISSNCKFTVLYESDKTKINQLISEYEKNPFHARVIFFNQKDDYSYFKTILFEHNDKEDFEIIIFKVSYGISTTNRIYQSGKKAQSFIYKDGKFWYINNIGHNRKIRALTFSTLFNSNEARSFFISKFPFIKTLGEMYTTKSYAITIELSINTIKKRKLFTPNKIKKYQLGVESAVADLVIEVLFRDSDPKYIKTWKEVLKVLDNPQCITKELISSHFFMDTCRMARILNKRVNCKWGKNRLKEEHDAWSTEINNIMLASKPEVDLEIHPIFIEFAEYSRFILFKTNKDLLMEGMKQHHCVGTYIDRVNTGECAIYHVGGYTLQLIRSKQINYSDGELTSIDLMVNQFRGLYNEEAPKELCDEVSAIVNNFNKRKIKLIEPKSCAFEPDEDGLYF